MARLVVVGGPKGGVGKTTLALNLATNATRDLGVPVLLVDADPNRSATDAAVAAGTAMPFDIATAGAGELRGLRESPHELVVVDLPGTGQGGAVSSLLGDQSDRNGIDRNGSDVMLLPTRPELMDLRPLLRALDDEVIPAGIPYLLALVRVHRDRMAAARDRREELRGMGYRTADTVTRTLVAHDDALEAALPLRDLPGGAHSAVRAADREYRALTAEVLDLAGLSGRTDPEKEGTH